MITESWYTLHSKYNCEHHYGFDPKTLPKLIQTITPDELEKKNDKYSEFIYLTKYFVKKLFYFLNDIPAMIIITDDSCNVLKVMGNEDLQYKMGVKEGDSFDEKYAGTNSIYLCLNHNLPIQVKGNEHFHKVFYDMSCSSCKFTLNNGLKGTITLATTLDKSSSFHLGLVSSAVDSIEREIELNKMNKQLNLFNQIIIKSTKNGIIITDQNGMITDYNVAAEKYTGIKKTDIIGRNINTFNDELKVFSRYIERTLSLNEKFENIEIHFLNNKLEKIFLFDTIPIYDGVQFIGTYSQFRDITDRYDLEQQVITNEKLSIIGKMSTSLAHEIRNPLTPISGFLKLLENNFDKAKSKEYFKIINDELHRMKDLINNFVMISKPEAPRKKDVNIHTLLLETIHLMNSHGNLHNISIEFTDNIKHDLSIYVDKNQIKQVLINLIQNAIEEMNAGGEINVVLNKNRELNQIEISVIDQGCGIDPKILSDLFTPFVTTKPDGTGLGLSISQRIVKNHYGEIVVDSNKNRGTTFTVTLPISIKNDRRDD